MSRGVGVAAEVLFLCVLLESITLVAVCATKPPYLVNAMSRIVSAEVSDPTQASAEIDRRIRAYARHRGVGHALLQLQTTAMLVAIWYLVDIIYRRTWRGLGDVFVAISLAGAVSTFGFLVREGMGAILRLELPPFTLAGLAPTGSVVASWLSRVDVVKLWWALILAVGLARIWSRSLPLTAAVTVVATLSWMLFGHIH
jgi:hypothetical protein